MPARGRVWLTEAEVSEADPRRPDLRAGIRFCATAPYQGGPIPITRARWSVRGDDGLTYPALATEIPGGYPVQANVEVNTCVQGEVPLGIPADVAMTDVLHSSTLGPVP